MSIIDLSYLFSILYTSLKLGKEPGVFEALAERTAGAGIAGAYLCYGAAFFPLAAPEIS